MHMELIVRFDYGSIVPWVRKVDDGLHEPIAGPTRWSSARRCATAGERISRRSADFMVSEGD